MVQEETKKEKEIFLEIQEKGVESKTTLKVMIPNASQIHSWSPLSQLGVAVSITKQALFSFSMTKIRDEALYRMFSLSAYQTLFGGSQLIDYDVNCKGHDQGQVLTFASLPPPHKYNPREGCKKILLMSETWVKGPLVRASHYLRYS